MLNNIIQYALHNRILVMFVSILLVLGGGYTTANMDVDVFPDLTAPTVVVMTEAHGMAPEEVEKLVTFPIETAVNGATNVRRLRSSSSAGFSIVWIEFEWGTDIYRARQIVSEKLLAVSENLPEGAGNPSLAPQSSIMGEVLMIGLQSDSISPMELRTLADWTIRPHLLAINGVAQVVVIGGEFKQYQILANPQKMRYYKVSLDELMKAARATNQNSAGGFINEYGNQYNIRGIARTSDFEELGNSVVKMYNNVPVRISDIAEVKVAAAPKLGLGTINSEQAVLLTVKKQPGINTLRLTENLDKSIAELSKSLPAGVTVNTHIFRQADFINSSIGNVKKALMEGSIFVIVILLVFLMNYRTTIISLLAIPISLLVTMITLKFLGITINTMTLGGMAIAVGDLVDDAIIDVENVYKRLRQNHLLPKEERKKPIKIVYSASCEIRSSIINATFIIIAAFLPLFFLSGMEGRMLQPLGIAFIVSLFASLVVALTLTPVLCSFMLTSDKMLDRKNKESWLVSHLNKWYGNSLGKALQHKKWILGGAGLLFIVSIFILTGLGRNFLPEFNEGSLTVTAITQPGISLEESNKVKVLAEDALRTVPEISLTARRTGRSELDEHSFGVNTSEIEVPFTLGERSKSEFLQEVREKLNRISGVNFAIGQPLAHRIDHILSGTKANIAIKIFGDDLNLMFKMANDIKTSISPIEGVVDVNVEQQVEIPQIRILPKRDMLAKYGISIAQFSEFIHVAFGGSKVSDVFEGIKAFDLVVKYDEENRGDIEAIRNALIDTWDGKKIPFSYVAKIQSLSGPNTVNRENVQRKLVVSANVADRDLRSVVTDIQNMVEQDVVSPEGYRIEYGGQFESEAKASRVLMIASIFSFMIIFLLLFQEFRSTQLASIILLNLPLALIGGVFTIYFTSGMLSIPAIIGFITLFGIATRNGILLISNYQSMKKKGLAIKDIIVQGSVHRLSPILMTALTAALALIPMAIAGDKPGNEIQSPMAVVILGGLLSSTLLNIYIIPIVYLLLNTKNKGNA
ncbi:efflux RND transporter permease subunit [Labilibaculum antarcticum]|uniref:CusA/CzcA family heavy metal efflux RND transporter n=1 Tax=Labilibaculum antarcticum TaxID=1717717 RepID=A0A1Y1CMF2_9BACT|nr:efflux RND transporter permease subunit [Labilibaculum antarcticum]BAX81619.1 CusA/CzcA family heavy metal efflux RND transporter [Labilibaculum antarcticum]